MFFNCLTIIRGGGIAPLLLYCLISTANAQHTRLEPVGKITLQTDEPTALRLVDYHPSTGIWATNQSHRIVRYDTTGRLLETKRLTFLTSDWSGDTLYRPDHLLYSTQLRVGTHTLTFKDWLLILHSPTGDALMGYLLGGQGMYPQPTPVDSSGFYAYLASSTPLLTGNYLYVGIRRSNKRDWPSEFAPRRDTLLADYNDLYGSYATFPALARFPLDLKRDTLPGPEQVRKLAYDKLLGRQGEHFRTAYKRGFYRSPSSQQLFLAWDGRRQRILTAPINHHHITAYDTSGTQVARFGQRGRHLRQPYFEGIPAAVFDSLLRAVQSDDSLSQVLSWFNTCSVYLTESYFDLHLDPARGLAYRLYQEPVLERPMSELIPYAFQSRAKLFALLRKDPSLFLQVYDLATDELVFDEPVPTPLFVLSCIDPQGILWAVTGVDEKAITVGRFRLVRE